MQLTISTLQDGQPGQLVTMPADLVAWEQWSGKSVASWSQVPPSYSDICYLAYRAATRGTEPRPDFLAWLDSSRITELTLEAVDSGSPTHGAASPA